MNRTILLLTILIIRATSTHAQVQLLNDLNPLGLSSNPSRLSPLHDKLYFVANDGNTGYELWSYDGNSFSLVQDTCRHTRRIVFKR